MNLKSNRIWSVTTEGDVEGKSTTNLGTFEGRLDEIAFALADKAYYQLQFKPSNISLEMIPSQKEVHVSLSIDSGTWNMEKKDRVEYFKNLVSENTGVVESNYYAAVKLICKNFDDKVYKDYRRKQILAKLTKEERKILGV